MATGLDTALEAQIEVIGRIKSFVSNYNKTPKDRFNLGYVTSRASGLKELWSEFVSNHKIIIAESTSETRENINYFVSDMFATYEDIYYEIFGRITQKHIEIVNATNPTKPPAQIDPIGQAPQVIQVSNPNQTQIPRLNVPPFSGRYEDWTSFQDLFVAAVHSNNAIQNVHKLQYLKSLLKGEAETLLRQTQVTAENYDIAWNTLKERFENKRVLITTHLRKLFNQPQAIETASSIRALLDSTRECTNGLKIQGIDISTWDSILTYIVSQFIPTTSLTLWEQTITRNEIPTYDGLLEFLENRFRVLEFSPSSQTSSHQGHTRNKQQAFHSVAPTCRVCQGPQHSLRSCPKFLDMQPQQRVTYVSNAKLCKNCFAYSHQTQSCISSGTCRLCQQRHNTLLHLNVQPHRATASTSDLTISGSSNSNTKSSSAPNPFNNTNASHASAYMSRPIVPNSSETILATALVNVIAFNGTSHSFRVLLDNASQENFVSKRVVQFLGTKPKPTSVVVSGIGKSQAPKPQGQIRFSFGSRYDEHFSMEINAIVLPMITYTLPTKMLIVDQNLVSGLELADPTYGQPGGIDILLSASVFAALTIPCLRKESSIATIALQTKLGWVLYGDASSDTAQQHRTCFHVTAEDRISSVLQEFWRMEEIPNPKRLTPDDAKCEEIFAQTHTRNSDGRYSVRLPFKQLTPLLGSSRDRAISRFMQMERKLATNSELRAEYSKCINEYLQLGHMSLVSTTENQHQIVLPNGTTTYSSYYLPHHAVVKVDSTTTKVRVVFDASSKSANGISLNETMFIGPTLQDNLFDLLLRWRSHRIVIKADIEKMYRQILVTEPHQSYQRIIWRNNPNDELQEYQLRTVTFGTAAAPYLAIKTLTQLAEDESTDLPIGAAALRNDFYVDDLLSGADSIGEAIERQHQVIKILQRGGFQIRKWSSNNNKLTDQLDETARDLCNSDSTLKALGILWCPSEDMLSIKVSSLSVDVSTKRSLLSEVSKLFDPLGWIAPSIIVMKIALQQLWLAGLSWDEPLPLAIQQNWNAFRHQLPSIEQIKIPRWTQLSTNRPSQLHGFCDASEKAFAAVVYIRVKTSETEWTTHLLTSKTRVAPVQQVSLPRLELCGAVLLSNLLKVVQSTLNISSIHAWSDSEIVLAWLQGHPSRWKTYVANRISEIHTNLEASAWKHVSSKDNPADCASRGISPDQLIAHNLWWNGPDWLARDDSTWPKKNKIEIPSTNLECRKTKQSFITIPINDSITQILNDCGTLLKAIRVTAFIRRWRSKPSSVDLTIAELDRAHDILLKHTQYTHFADEFDKLANKLPIHKTSKLMSLNPFLDHNQFLRVGGRLENADIPQEVRHPLIVPHKSRFTELLLDDTHKKTKHGGMALMLSHLRTRFWIIDARNAIRHRIHKCNICFRFSTPNLNQLMGNLPKPRVNITNPFNHTGLDYAGPISILLQRRPGRPTYIKGYICIFVCLATKAIHLELVGDMSTPTFLAAFDRFSSRRGLPSDMYSDNGTYFVGASNEIEHDMQLIQTINPQEAAKQVTNKSVQWHFIPPAAPHFGGLWEAGVKSTKYHLRRILGNGICTYEEMSTILCQIEGCLNSRPLCPISADPDDFQILTPGHFLIGRPILSRPQPSLLEVPTNRLKYWQRIYQMTERFWKQWQSEYLARLQQRPKWVSQMRNVERGDLVILKDDNTTPSQWQLARIIDTHSGADGLIRVVTIKTPTATLKRPIVKICQLPSQ